MRSGSVRDSELEWLDGQSPGVNHLEPRATRSGVVYEVTKSDVDSEDEITTTSKRKVNTSKRNVTPSKRHISPSKRHIRPSEVMASTSYERINTSHEVVDLTDEDEEVIRVSVEADTNTDIASQDSNGDESQPDEEPASRSYPADGGTTVDSWLEEWPDKSPEEGDLADMQRYSTAEETFVVPGERHSQKFRDKKYGKAHFWLPSAFDYPRGRPYEIICERVWASWRRWRHDSLMMDASPSIEPFGKRDWPNAGPKMLNFPEHRIRHKKPRSSD
ncbi:hypothetical protein M436DRAFT_79059 [Aureobasidium namibiae CBS 147.97]|uniref:Uncharacterized protein n=1 Tax=Aureobasidium namibiae CBS 147.97 TaxID=1043004 RepID=A0A074XMI1_9PEZI